MIEGLFKLGMIWLIAAFLTHSTVKEFRIIKEIKLKEKELEYEFGA